MTDVTGGAGPDPAMLVALGSAGLLMLGALWAVARGRGQRPFSGFSLLLGAGAAALTVVLPALAFGAVLKVPVMTALLVGGALAGLVLGLRPRLGSVDGTVTLAGGAWLGVPLALSVACLQVAGALQSADGVILAVGALHIAAALVVGSAFILVVRRLALGRVRPAAGVLPAVPVSSSAASVSAMPPSVVAPAPTAPPRTVGAGPAGFRTADVVITCAACGSPVSVGWRHCVSCGAALAWG